MSTGHSGKSAAARSRAWAEKAGHEMMDASATDVLAWAFAEFGSGLAVASSMADAVLPHLASQVFADTVPAEQQGGGPHILFLDTGYHFAETLATRDEVARRLPVTVRSITPRLSVADQDLVHGQDLFNTDPGACCHMRKVEPLSRALRGYRAWASGLRRSDSPSRADTPLVSWDPRHQLVKINPIAAWSDEQVEAYIAEHDVPVNPLLKQGYTSIGCGPCTLRPLFGADPRSGRWAGTTKTECGLHP
ncbi:MAG TPA: phosphoadenylyl-sulfate reductase [Ornithinimicrobium sp.]|uniref:phosphoadenylyl-sulfate reductase n=1 Tax=Ornithinimicrobium sp. TaxID=1977084 RepID=UPI002B4A6310|nr:phosphoadenylyl-sulfate reductase [Ornithinimicrobium sp.]HKJ10848.1 phosphoadenylyl-sulfate reductase [Ornithinimicrobium sp.]